MGLRVRVLYKHSRSVQDITGRNRRVTVACVVIGNIMQFHHQMWNLNHTKKARTFYRNMAEGRARKKPTIEMDVDPKNINQIFQRVADSIINRIVQKGWSYDEIANYMQKKIERLHAEERVIIENMEKMSDLVYKEKVRSLQTA